VAHYTLIVENAVPIPVNHRIKIDMFEQNLGTRSPGGQRWSPRPEHSTITDLETGVAYLSGRSHGTNFVPYNNAVNWWRFAKTYWGVVTSCEVRSSDYSDRKHTRLVIFPTEDPAKASAPYR
jgi:hypothetical protein